MQRTITGWYSPALQKEMPVATYGHYGAVLLMVPTAAADYLEYERFRLIDSLAWFINEGRFKLYSVNSVNNESWMNCAMSGPDKAYRHHCWNEYMYNEVIPFIKNTSGQHTPVYICGASFGALHSMNLFLKRPDLLQGVIAMSGVYDLRYYTSGYTDETVYYNSPQQYLPHLTDENILSQIRQSRHIHILTGSGNYEDPKAGGEFAQTLYHKGIPYDFQNWGDHYPHDWNTWRQMLPTVLSTNF